MCGIAGWIFFSRERAEAERPRIESYMKAALASLSHRGPDASRSVWVGYGAIGARRLAIVDLAGGDQPIASEDGSVVVAFNGEIYNFRELRRRLEGSGHRLRTNSDTEVLAHGFEEWSVDLPRHLAGMFAFAAIDVREPRLFLCRDRLGKKPLFYACFDGGIRFASELKALMADGLLRPRLDPESVAVLLELQHLPPPLTPFEDVHQLMPGTALVCELGAGADTGGLLRSRARTARYWDITDYAVGLARSKEGSNPHLEQQPSENFDSSLPDRDSSSSANPLVREAIDRLTEAAVSRTFADVPVGIYLSGGIDSSLVAAVLARAGFELQAFSVGFSDLRFDEVDKARAVATHLGLPHTVTHVGQPTAKDLRDIVWYLDEPLADSSCIPSYQIAREASRELRVVISGDGGDEFFGGYPKHHEFARLLPALVAVRALAPSAAREAAAALLGRLRGLLDSGNLSRRMTPSMATPMPKTAKRSEGLQESRPRPSYFYGSPARKGEALLRRGERFLRLASMSTSAAYLDFLAAIPVYERALAAGAWLEESLSPDILGRTAAEILSAKDPVLGRVLGESSSWHPFPRNAPAFGEPFGAKARPLGILGRMALIDAVTELPGDILVKVDRTSMACSLEVRSPFLDHRLVQWALALPDSVRSRRGETKPLLRDAVRALLPPEIASAPKRGFGVPLSEWMRGQLGVVAAEVLLDPQTTSRGLIHPDYAAFVLQANAAGHSLGPRIWQLLVLELWARMYVDASPPRPYSV
jgi:asparagine synthase (glutamine-hydrolysing)